MLLWLANGPPTTMNDIDSRVDDVFLDCRCSLTVKTRVAAADREDNDFVFCDYLVPLRGPGVQVLPPSLTYSPRGLADDDWQTVHTLTHTHTKHTHTQCVPTTGRTFAPIFERPDRHASTIMQQ
jgi:hypothetical protein